MAIVTPHFLNPLGGIESRMRRAVVVSKLSGMPHRIRTLEAHPAVESLRIEPKSLTFLVRLPHALLMAVHSLLQDLEALSPIIEARNAVWEALGAACGEPLLFQLGNAVSTASGRWEPPDRAEEPHIPCKAPPRYGYGRTFPVTGSRGFIANNRS